MLSALPIIEELPNSTYLVEIEKVTKTRVIFDPPQTVVVFRVLDPDPDTSSRKSKHPHKQFTGRKVRSWFDLDSKNTETARQAEAQFGYLTKAAGEVAPGSVLKVRVDRVYMRSDPSRKKTTGVEFLPYEFDPE